MIKPLQSTVTDVQFLISVCYPNAFLKASRINQGIKIYEGIEIYAEWHECAKTRQKHLATLPYSDSAWENKKKLAEIAVILWML